MGISIRAYARQRGVSETAVRKAIKTGRIMLEPDGMLDPARADAQWDGNTDVAQQRPAKPVGKPVPNEAIQSVRETVGESSLSSGIGSGGTTFLQARTANEVLKAQTNKLRLARLKGELVDRSQAIAQVFKLARAERDAWTSSFYTDLLGYRAFNASHSSIPGAKPLGEPAVVQNRSDGYFLFFDSHLCHRFLLACGALRRSRILCHRSPVKSSPHGLDLAIG